MTTGWVVQTAFGAPPPAGVVKASLDAAPSVMLNAALVAETRPGELAIKVYPVPDLLMLRPENVLTPATAAPVVVPERIPADGLVPIATVMAAVEVVTGFPFAS